MHYIISTWKLPYINGGFQGKTAELSPCLEGDEKWESEYSNKGIRTWNSHICLHFAGHPDSTTKPGQGDPSVKVDYVLSISWILSMIYAELFFPQNL